MSETIRTFSADTFHSLLATQSPAEIQKHIQELRQAHADIRNSTKKK